MILKGQIVVFTTGYENYETSIVNPLVAMRDFSLEEERDEYVAACDGEDRQHGKPLARDRTEQFIRRLQNKSLVESAQAKIVNLVTSRPGGDFTFDDGERLLALK